MISSSFSLSPWASASVISVILCLFYCCICRPIPLMLPYPSSHIYTNDFLVIPLFWRHLLYHRYHLQSSTLVSSAIHNCPTSLSLRSALKTPHYIFLLWCSFFSVYFSSSIFSIHSTLNRVLLIEFLLRFRFPLQSNPLISASALPTLFRSALPTFSDSTTNNLILMCLIPSRSFLLLVIIFNLMLSLSDCIGDQVSGGRLHDPYLSISGVCPSLAQQWVTYLLTLIMCVLAQISCFSYQTI